MSRGFWTLLLVACNDGTTDGSSDVPGGDDTTPADTDVTDTGGTPEDTDTTQRDGCYADWAGDTFDDGTVDGTGIDIYDPVRTDLIVDAERFYSFLDQWAYHYTYDQDGNITGYEYDDGNDGSPDTIYAYTWEDGRYTGYFYDEDGDGDWEEIRTYTYTAEGLFEGAEYDTDGDGDTDYSYWYEYDENDRAVVAYEDVDANGTTDIWYTYTYDGADRVIRVEGDTGNNGTVNYLATYTYTDPVLEVGSGEADYENDGILDYTEQFAEDADGNQLFSEQDEGADGVINYRLQATYTEDGQPLVVDLEVAEDPEDGDTAYVVHDEYTYDTSLRQVGFHEDGTYSSAGQEFALLSSQAWTFGGTCP